MLGKIFVVAVIVATIFTVGMIFAVQVPAGIQYNQAFGSDVNMATEGSTTLTGLNSIQSYVLDFWNNMNQTFNTNNFNHIYNSPWPWDQIPQNSMAKENSYLNSLNASITQRQIMVDNAIKNGNYLIDPVQNAINQTRNEMNAYGGLDWVVHDAWYLQNASLAYWSWAYIIIAWIIAIVILIAAAFAMEA